MLVPHKTYKDNRLSTVTHLKHIWECERESTYSPTWQKIYIFNNLTGIKDNSIILHNNSAGAITTFYLYVVYGFYDFLWSFRVMRQFKMHGRTLNVSNMNHSTGVGVNQTTLRSEHKVKEANEDIWDCFFVFFLKKSKQQFFVTNINLLL